jgi:hypothetical protein
MIFARVFDDKVMYFKMICDTVTVALILKPELSHTEKITYLVIISLLSLAFVLRNALSMTYYLKRLDTMCLYFKILKAAYFVAASFTVMLELTYKEFLIIIVVIFPILSGSSMMLKSYNENKLFKDFVSGKLKNDRQIEMALYLILDYMVSNNPIEHQKFQSLILWNDESTIDESQSYYSIIS